MKKALFLFILLFLTFIASAQKVYRTSSLVPNIKTLQIHPTGEPLALPIIELGSSMTLSVLFDEMSHDIHSYSYRVILCNADWTENTKLSTNEYIRGFARASITDYSLSVNTTFLYTNYQFSLPNDELSFLKSGNYVVQIYEDDKPQEPLAQVCFSVVEPLVGVSGKVRGNTELELNRSMQQLDFEIKFKGHAVNNPREEIKVLVRQNNRTDNEVYGIKPTYLQGDVLSYVNNRSLIFEGGSEYSRFDISSVYTGSSRVEHMEYKRPHYNAYLYPDYIRQGHSYVFDQDVNGKYVVNLQGAYSDLNSEADYLYVHFFVPKPEPFFDGQLYIGGAWNNNFMDKASQMQYDFRSGNYFKTLLLKQGGYNYQYWFLPKGEKEATTKRVSGSFWQTQNEYVIYVYQREWGGRYDRLIGLKVLE